MINIINKETIDAIEHVLENEELSCEFSSVEELMIDLYADE